MRYRNRIFNIIAVLLIGTFLLATGFTAGSTALLTGSSFVILGVVSGALWMHGRLFAPLSELSLRIKNFGDNKESPASFEIPTHGQLKNIYEDCHSLLRALTEMRLAKDGIERQLVSHQNTIVVLEAQMKELERNLMFQKTNLKDAQAKITELRRSEKSLTLEKNLAIRNSQAKSEFLAKMSHEIRTPMNAIMGMAELLKETKLSADQEYYVTIFCKAGEVLLALINDILDLSKIEAGEVSIENINFDLRKILSDVEEMMKPRALEKSLEYSSEISPQVTTHLVGDSAKIRQILINLVGNALKFTEHGNIRVSVAKNPSRKDSLLFSVSDSGVGIAPQMQHLIFKKFSQGDNTISRRYGGTGLGLAISKSLIELMGGHIWFKSREGTGTTFFFTLPCHEQILSPESSTQLPVEVGKSTVGLEFTESKHRDPEKKIRILVADDAEDNRTLFTHYLRSGPYEIIEAHNGLEAIDKIKSREFDIVFMDVQMPEMDGYAATDSVRKWEAEQHKAPTPIIALTAHALSEDRQKSLQAGCNDHIAKPFKKETLVGVINRYSL